MNKDEFIARFRPTIRVNLDWSMFKEDNTTLFSVTLNLPREINRLWTPWFPGGMSHHFADPSAEPLSALGAASDITLLGSHEQGIRHCIERINDDDIEAPAVAFPRQRYLLLDQNHHIVAAAVKELHVRLQLSVIVPPLGKHILTDVPALK